MASKKIQIVGLDLPQSDWNQTDETQLDYIDDYLQSITEAQLIEDVTELIDNYKKEML